MVKFDSLSSQSPLQLYFKQTDSFTMSKTFSKFFVPAMFLNITCPLNDVSKSEAKVLSQQN